MTHHFVVGPGVIAPRRAPRSIRQPFSAACYGLILATCVACARPAELSVDLRTDIPRDDFDAVVTTVSGTGPLREVRRPLSRGEAFRFGGRVADLRSVAPGNIEVEVRLEREGEVRARRRVRLAFRRDYALTVSIDAACDAVTCTGETPSCASGICVREECGGGVPGACGELSCASDNQCAIPGCPVAHCEHGGCVCAPRTGASPDAALDASVLDASVLDASVPDAGPLDAGCECTFEEVDTAMRPCGCGVGTETRSRMCDGCRWGAFSDWTGCAAECGPGDLDEETRPCGPCGAGLERRTRTCGATCSFGAWSEWSSCEGAGECAPGATRTGCDPCGHEVCTAACAWGACEPFSGSECLRIRPGTAGPPGNNYRCCGTDRWQFCLDTCMWSTSCDSCDGCSVC